MCNNLYTNFFIYSTFTVYMCFLLVGLLVYCQLWKLRVTSTFYKQSNKWNLGLNTYMHCSDVFSDSSSANCNLCRLKCHLRVWVWMCVRERVGTIMIESCCWDEFNAVLWAVYWHRHFIPTFCQVIIYDSRDCVTLLKTVRRTAEIVSKTTNTAITLNLFY